MEGIKHDGCYVESLKLYIQSITQLVGCEMPDLSSGLCWNMALAKHWGREDRINAPGQREGTWGDEIVTGNKTNGGAAVQKLEE